MHLSQLTVRNFRNLAALDLTFPPEGVVILGPNGHGKTNLLEAIYYLVLFRSFRGARDRELVRFGEAGFFLGGERAVGEVGEVGEARTASPASPPASSRLAVGYDAAERRKKVTLGGVAVRKLSDAVGVLAAVVVSPADRAMVSGGPAARRRYLDIVLSLTVKGYMAHLGAMRAALQQRNAALRRGKPDEARAFDRPFAAAAARVVAQRRAWVGRWRERYAALLAQLGERGTAALCYRQRHPGDEADREAMERALAVTLERDLRRGMTTIGPHRDDLELQLDGRALRLYGSAGQQRTAAIVLRLLEAEALRESRGAPPVGLYDDVFAELDAERQTRLLSLIRDTLPGQAIVAAPRESEVPGELLERERWSVLEGRIG